MFKKHSFFFLVTSTFLLSALCTGRFVPTAFAQERKALVIGNADYDDSRADLNNPVNDAHLMKEELEGLGFSVRYRTNVSKAGLATAISKFVSDDIRTNDVAVVYYAGHGMQINDRNYLLGVDFRGRSEIDGQYEAYEVQRLFEHLEASPASVRITIIDACRDDPFSRSWNRSLRGRGFAAVAKIPTGWYLVFSSGAGEPAADGSGSNSPFTEALAKHMTEPGLDISQLFRKVRRTLESRGLHQVPETRETMTGEFSFVPRDGTGPILAPPPTEQAVPHGMVYVPKGCFTMGSGEHANQPETTVCLSAYAIDRKNSGTPDDATTWDEADRTCRSRGLELATEAQWEKAAAGHFFAQLDDDGEWVRDWYVNRAYSRWRSRGGEIWDPKETSDCDNNPGKWEGIRNPGEGSCCRVSRGYLGQGYSNRWRYRSFWGPERAKDYGWRCVKE
ncbi:MAG: caspase family protein [Pseudomonadota bacterium]